MDPQAPQKSNPATPKKRSAAPSRHLFIDLLAEVASKRKGLQSRNQQTSNGLVGLEREITLLANSKGVSVSALREAMRQLLRGAGKNGRVSVQPKLPKTPSVDSALEKTASALSSKRGRGRGSTTSLIAEHIAAMEAAAVVAASPLRSTKKPPVSVVVNNLSGAEACSNVRRLALFALDELLEGKEPPPPVLLPADLAAELNTPPASPRPPSMRELFVRGGSDSTCFILPHPGGSSSSGSRGSKRSRAAATSTSATEDGLENVVPSSKRARSSSSTSSSLPVLSPQKVEEQSGQDGENTENQEEREGEEQDSELNSHRLMTDSRGYCPLRARSEIIRRGDPALWPIDADSESAEGYALRCLCVSTVLRNLSFLPSAERVLSQHKAVLALAGRLLTIAHTHFDQESADWACVEEHAAHYDAHSAWWMPWIDELCENILVLLVNISGHLQCISLHESIARPLLEGLLHWATCQTAAATDPLPGHRVISPCRLALEALNRLSVNEANVSMLLATIRDGPTAGKLFDRLASWLALPEDQVTRELALSTIHYLTEPPSNASHPQGASDGCASNNATTYGLSMLAQAKPCPVAGLTSFIEMAEAKTRKIIDQYGVQALQEQPELMGTSLELVRRAGALLERLAANPVGRARFSPELELRLLGLATSRVLDATVAQLLSGCLFNLPQRDTSDTICGLIPELPSPERVARLIAPLLEKKEDPKPAIKKEDVVTKEEDKGEEKENESEKTTSPERQQPSTNPEQIAAV